LERIARPLAKPFEFFCPLCNLSGLTRGHAQKTHTMRTILFFFALLIVHATSAQQLENDCSRGQFPTAVGTKFTVSHFDKKGKMTAYVDHELYGIQETDLGPELAVGTNTYGPTDRLEFENMYDVYCYSNETYFDLMHFLHPLTVKSLMDFTVEVNGSGLKFPVGMQKGDTLTSGEMLLRMMNNDKEMQRILITTKNLRVLGVDQRVSTPAGTFNCTKVALDLSVNRGFTDNYKVILFISPQGMVRVEYRDAKNKLQHYTQYTKFKGPA